MDNYVPTLEPSTLPNHPYLSREFSNGTCIYYENNLPYRCVDAPSVSMPTSTTRPEVNVTPTFRFSKYGDYDYCPVGESRGCAGRNILTKSNVILSTSRYGVRLLRVLDRYVEILSRTSYDFYYNATLGSLQVWEVMREEHVRRLRIATPALQKHRDSVAAIAVTLRDQHSGSCALRYSPQLLVQLLLTLCHGSGNLLRQLRLSPWSHNKHILSGSRCTQISSCSKITTQDTE